MTRPRLRTNMLRLSRLLLLLLLTYRLIVQAADVPSIVTREEDPSSCVGGLSKRTLFNIVWGCVSTTIICAWASVHPNVPPREGPFKATLRKLELVFWTIVVPETFPAWAFNQWLAAKMVRDVYNKGKGVFSYLFQWMCLWNKVRLSAGEKRNLENFEGVVFVLRDQQSCKSRWVF